MDTTTAGHVTGLAHACGCTGAVPATAAAGWRLPIEHHGVRCHYQPIVDAAGVVVAHEALLRAGDPAAPLPPSELFAAASEEGWSTWLDQTARRAAIEGAAGWLGDRQLFVNFLPSTVYDPQRCLATTSDAARRVGLRMEQLVFEVVETEAIRDVDHLLRVFAEYRRMGCRVALDDVGSGHSTVDVVVELRPDVVKLDRALVAAIPGGERVDEVQAIIAAAGRVGAIVLAEGVETEEQLHAARRAGATLTQGWLHGRPVPMR